ncbi:hypothetical protein ACIGCP_17535 [Cellulophaga baltica]|uniref:hypothetical protein n=1 Tax=Cellulophaga baltica TaxID=76594 RepID=UPI0037CA40F0
MKNILRNKKVNTRIAVLGLIITIILGFLYHLDQSMIGFPDGHLTEYDRFYKKVLYPIFFFLNTIFFIAFILSVFVKTKPKQILVLYFILMVIYLVINNYFSLNLENGQGS